MIYDDRVPHSTLPCVQQQRRKPVELCHRRTFSRSFASHAWNWFEHRQSPQTKYRRPATTTASACLPSQACLSRRACFWKHRRGIWLAGSPSGTHGRRSGQERWTANEWMPGGPSTVATFWAFGGLLPVRLGSCPERPVWRFKKNNDNVMLIKPVT